MRLSIFAAPVAGLLLVFAAGAWSPSRAAEPTPSFDEIKGIISARCQSCHSESPDQPGIYDAPAGIKLDTAEEIHMFAPRIYEKAVKTQYMPLGNITKITDDERQKLGAWITAGAKVQ